MPPVELQQNRPELLIRVMALLELPGVGPSTVHRLRERFGSLTATIVWLEGGEPVLPDDPAMARIRSAWSHVKLGKYRGWLAETEDSGDFVVIADDYDYPVNLRDVRTVPPLLYVRGSLQELRAKSLALVGAVDPTPRGLARADKLARMCVQNDVTVISGLARGIDGAAHRASLRSGAATFACVGHGLRSLYPSEHRELANQISVRGALVSQFPPDVKPAAWTFPARNELMCTLAKGTVIVEIERTEKLGSVIQAKFSVKHGRPVFILRSNIAELGSTVASELVEAGVATPVGEFPDILGILEKSNPLFRAPSPIALDMFERVPSERAGAEWSSAEAGELAVPSQPRRAILFDMDGVFHDIAAVVPAAYHEAVVECGARSSGPDAYTNMLRDSPPRVFRRVGVDPSRAGLAFNRAYNRLVAATPCTHEEVVEFMRRAHARGFVLGVVTSQPRNRAQLVIDCAGIQDLLDVVVTYHDTKRRKPHPDPILHALRIMNVPPENAVYVGDTPSDLQAAREARVRGIAVGWGVCSENELRKWSPDMYAATPAELTPLLEP